MVITIDQRELLTLFLTLLMSCVLILFISSGTCSLKSTPNNRFFKKFFMAALITLRVVARNPLRKYCRRNTFCIWIRCLIRNWNFGFTFNKPTHYLLDYGDFDTQQTIKNVVTIESPIRRSPKLSTLRTFIWLITYAYKRQDKAGNE